MDTNTAPEFNWKISSTDNNVVQSYYNIKLFEETPNNDILIWESGKINSDQSQRIVYTGEQKLIENNKYYWIVKVGANNGSESKWSSKSYIHTLPSNIRSKAEWIGAIDIKDSNIPNGRNYHGLSISSEEGQKWQQTNPLSRQSIYLRKNFQNKKEIHNATIYISGLGHYELSINGDKIGDAQFDPMWSDYDKTVYFNAFDVTNILKQNNSIGVLLGNGFFNEQGGRYAKMQVSFGPPTLFFKLHITYKDGSTNEIVSDETWKYSPSPITYNDMYGGENYDAQLEQVGWNTINFNDEDWTPVVIQNGPKGALRFQTADPIKIMKTYSTQATSRVEDSYIFDMGQNLSGFPKIRVKGNKGDKITIKVGESLKTDGSIDQLRSGSPYYYEYTLRGSDVEEWQPRFSYYGYKYIQVEGAKPKNIDDNRSIPVIESIESQFVHNSTNTAGSFKCSNEIFTKTHELVVNAMKSNMHAVFTDCPHREKLGWLEQVHLNSPGPFYNFDLTKFIPKVMQDIRDAQLENGLVPDIAPEYVIFEDGF